jgi:nicotinamidase-related amidase
MKRLFCALVFAFAPLMALGQDKGAFSNAKQTALVIIDMQDFFATRYGVEDVLRNRAKVNDMIWRIRLLIQAAKRNNTPIMIVEYADTGPTNKQIMDELRNYGRIKVIQKDSDDLFNSSNSSAAIAQFQSWGIKNLVIVGANAEDCVEQTIQGALNNGYHVMAANNSIASFNDYNFKHPYYYNEGEETNRGLKRGGFHEKVCPYTDVTRCHTRIDLREPTFFESDDATDPNTALGDPDLRAHR